MNYPLTSSLLTTAGDLLFTADAEGNFLAFDAKTGEQLYSFNTGSGTRGSPITYAVNGRQYIAVVAGVGGWAGGIVDGDLDPRDPTAALGFANAVKDLPDKTTPGGMLYVFALPRK